MERYYRSSDSPSYGLIRGFIRHQGLRIATPPNSSKVNQQGSAERFNFTLGYLTPPLFTEEHNLIASPNSRYICHVHHDGIHGNFPYHWRTLPIYQDNAFIGKSATVAIREPHGNIRKF